MPGAGRIRTLFRAGLLATAALAVVFAPAALPRAGATDAADLAAAVLAPSDGGDAWRPLVPQDRTDDVGLALLAVLVAAVVVPSLARRSRSTLRCATQRDEVHGRRPSDRAPPALVVV